MNLSRRALVVGGFPLARIRVMLEDLNVENAICDGCSSNLASLFPKNRMLVLGGLLSGLHCQWD